MHVTAGLPSFYKPCFKKTWAQYLGAETNSMVQIYQQPGYYDFSLLTFSSSTKYLYWKAFGWNFSCWNGLNVLRNIS